ncbi:MAG: hypothetical protein ACRCYQ_08415 [Nocardioides sp.]
MPEIRTDDGPRRLRGVWLGPKGLRWPVDWTYVQWAVFVLVTLVAPLTIYSLLFWLSPAIAGFTGVLAGPLIAYEVTTRLPQWLDYDRPLRHWVHVWRSEFQSSVRVARLGETKSRPVLPSGALLTSGGRYLLYPPSLPARGSQERDAS